MGSTTKNEKLGSDSTVKGGNTGTKPQPGPATGALIPKGGSTGSSADKTQADEADKDSTGEPVDTLTGNVIFDDVDFELPGVIPLSIARHYSTAFRGQPSVFGLGGWVLSLEQWITPHEDGLRLREASGDTTTFPSLQPGETRFIRSKRYEVTSPAPDNYRVLHTSTGLIREFTTTRGQSLARLRRIVDPRGNRIELLYQGERLVEVVDTAKRHIVLSFNPEGQVTQLAVTFDEQELTHVRYGYHPSGELAWMEDPLGYREHFDYDAHHRMVKHTWKNGVSFYYHYDPESGECVRTWGDGGLHEYEFLREATTKHIKVTVTGPEDPIIKTFSFAGDLLEERSFDDQCVVTRTYDENHYVLSESNALGETTTWEYDSFGYPTTFTDPAGNSALMEYAFFRPKRLRTANGLTVHYQHNDYGELTGVRFPTGAEYCFDYDEYGRVSTVFGPDGVTARFVYDSHHNVVEEHDAKGSVWLYSYDLLGRPISRTDPLGAITRLEYDARNMVVKIIFADGSVVQNKYEALGNVSDFTDPLGQTTHLDYTGTGSLVSETSPDGTTWRFDYDTVERLIQVTNPKHERYRFFYDRAGHVEREETFDGRVLRYTFDRAGRLLQLTKPDQTFRRFTYNNLGLITQEDSTHGPQKYERDVYGRLVTATLVDGPEIIRLEFERDTWGRIVRERQGDHTIQHTLDSQGQRTQRTIPWCGTTDYHFDVTGSLSRLEHQTPGGMKQILTFERDPLGREIARKSQDERLRISQAYDVMDRLIEQKIGAPKTPGQAAQQLTPQRHWRYDLGGRVRQLDDTRWGTTSYEYDQLGQLTSARRGQLHEVFDYQSNGSLVRALNERAPLLSTAQTARWDIGGGNLLRSTGQHTYEYDLCHRRTAKVDRQTGARTEYIWDCRDRLREVHLPDGRRARYFYDAFGRRVRKELTPSPTAALLDAESLPIPALSEKPLTAEGLDIKQVFGTELTDALQQLAAVAKQMAPRVTQFLWDGDELAAELDSETGPRGHVHCPGTFVPLLQIERGQILVVVTDHLGTPRDLVGEDGTVRWSATYTAWGKIQEEYVAGTQAPRGPPEHEHPGVFRSPFRLMGQYFDEETGLSATRFRMWETETGRWLSPDPLGIAGGENLLGFNGSPTTNWDPLGLCPKQHATPFKPLTKKQLKALKAKQRNRTLTREEFRALEWHRRFANRRARGVSRFWAQEKRALESGQPGTRNWTPEQRAAILAGRTPQFGGEAVEGHHMYNALDHPQIADSPANIYPASANEHFNRWHGSNFQNDTFGSPLNPSFTEEF